MLSLGVSLGFSIEQQIDKAKEKVEQNKDFKDILKGMSLRKYDDITSLNKMIEQLKAAKKSIKNNQKDEAISIIDQKINTLRNIVLKYKDDINDKQQ